VHFPARLIETSPQAFRQIKPKGIHEEDGCFAEIASLDKLAPEPRVGDRARPTANILTTGFKGCGESAR
jgi:hypothetical protein